MSHEVAGTQSGSAATVTDTGVGSIALLGQFSSSDLFSEKYPAHLVEFKGTPEDKESLKNLIRTQIGDLPTNLILLDNQDVPPDLKDCVKFVRI